MSPSAVPTRAVRPYTSYNLFFQLEREYILQVVHGHKPNVGPNDMFDPTDKANYQGPPLPSRYNDLILLNDWHVPGKTQRRKRLHRKSHGLVGFHELNERVSKAWSVVDEETKSFCTRLSDIESTKYKKPKKAQAEKKMKVAKTPTIFEPENENSDACKDHVISFDWTVSFSPHDVPALDEKDKSLPKICRIVSEQLVGRESLSNASHHNEPFRLQIEEVDMEDEDIIELWKTTSIKDRASSFTMDISNIVPSDASIDKKEQIADRRKLFIDSEYVRFRDIGMKLSSKAPFSGKVKMKALIC